MSALDVFDAKAMEARQRRDRKGTHTFALAPQGDHLYAFLPATHRAAIYQATDPAAQPSA